MAYIEINGGVSLEGEIKIQGSKNAVLPILAASLLNKGSCVIKGCPFIDDVENMLCLLRGVGCRVDRNREKLTIDAREMEEGHLEERYAKTMRSSVFFIGAMLGRCGFIRIPYPGGCSIGKRPIDIHLNALRSMNVEVLEKEDGIVCKSNRMKGAEITLPFPSVGATENVILAAVMAEGRTILKNPAKEPEIMELCRFLRGMGAIIQHCGNDTICIQGVKSLHDVEYNVPSDRIVAGTYLAALAATGGVGILKADCGKSMTSTIEVLRRAGCEVSYDEHYIWILAPKRLMAVPWIETRPYPGFPTDMQSQLAAVLSTAKGRTTIVETIFEARYACVEELKKLGANISVQGNRADINGVRKLKGNTVQAKELRGGAALILAGLMAEGTTKVENIFYVERGYEKICENLSCMGARIEKKEQ